MTNVKTLHTIIYILAILIVILFYFGFIKKDKPYDYKSAKHIKTFVTKKIALASGVNIDGKAVIVNSLSGEKQKPCGKINIKNNLNNNTYDLSIKEKSGCETSVKGDKGDVTLDQIINHTNNPIQGIITKNGVETPAIFQVSVQASFKGSYCTTTFMAGNQYENCVTQTLECEVLREDLAFLTLAEFLLEVPECENLITE